MNYKGAVKLVLVFVLNATILAGSFVYAQEDTSTDSVQDPVQQLQQSEIQKKEEQLRQQLQELEEELQEVQKEVDSYKLEADSYDRDISILEGETRAIEIKIQRNQLVINQTDFAIKQNEETIVFLTEKAQKQRGLLGKLILNIYKLDDTSSLEIILTSDTISEFFNDLNQIKTLQESMKNTLDKIKEIKFDIDKEQIVLEQRSHGQLKLIRIQELEQVEVEHKADEKEVLLDASRSREYVARETASATQRSINEIKNQLFVLSGGADAITFGQAYELAKLAESLTGVRPAFLLALIELESLWGANVGQCYLKNTETGEGIVISTGVVRAYVMKPMGMSGRRGDVDAFIKITQELGMDPFTTPVSCPSAAYRGWGGAMGAAQFIPTTWMGYKDRITELVGSLANPWNIRDAFLASAIKLADAGAASRVYQKEFNAAMRYLSGGRWTHNEEHIYGEPIMNRAQQLQRDIDILEGR